MCVNEHVGACGDELEIVSGFAKPKQLHTSTTSAGLLYTFSENWD